MEKARNLDAKFRLSLFKCDRDFPCLQIHPLYRNPKPYLNVTSNKKSANSIIKSKKHTMEKRIFRIEIALLIIIVMVVTNLVLFLYQSQNNRNRNDIVVGTDNILPEKFDESFQNDLLFNIKNCYNDKNYKDLYLLFGKYARMQFSESKMKDNFGELISFTGNIIDYAYETHEFLGEEANVKYYKVTYRAKFTKGMGKITISIREIENEIELNSVNVNLEKRE